MLQNRPRVAPTQRRATAASTLGNASVRHEVSPAPGSRVASSLGSHVDANCNHHQALNELGAGVRVVGRTADGVIEEVELEDNPFAVSVQWHPEESSDIRLFQALVDAASAGRSTIP